MAQPIADGEAIILAGGLGTRLRPVVGDLPKVLAPVAGRPFLAYQLELLAAHGFTRVVLAVGYRHDAVRAAFGDHFAGLELVYAVEASPLGTGGAIRHAHTLTRSPAVFVLNGDTYLEAPFVQMQAALAVCATDLVLAACQVGDCGRFGRLELSGSQVTAFREKAPSQPGLVNAGVYLLAPGLFDRFPCAGAFSWETGFLEARLPALTITAVVAANSFLDIGIPADYALAEQRLIGREQNRQLANRSDYPSPAI